MYHISLYNMFDYFHHKCSVSFMSPLHFASNSDQLFPVELSADVSNMVGFVIPLFLALRGDAFIDVLLIGVAFNPSDFNSTGSFGLNRFEEVLPKVPITDKFPWLVWFPAFLDVLYNGISSVDKCFAISLGVAWG